MNIWQDSNNATSIPNSTTADETNVVKYYENNKPVYYTRSELNTRKEMYMSIITDLKNERDNKGSNKSFD